MFTSAARSLQFCDLCCVFVCAVELAARTSQQEVLSREVDTLRTKCVDLQTQVERLSSQLAKATNEADIARATTQRLQGQLEDTDRRKRELEVEFARMRGSRDVDVAAMRRVEQETAREQEKYQDILKELETLQVMAFRLCFCAVRCVNPFVARAGGSRTAGGNGVRVPCGAECRTPGPHQCRCGGERPHETGDDCGESAVV